MNSKSSRRGGLYWVDKKPYLSVTTVLGIIDKPALRFWYGQQVHRAMVQDPSLSEKDALAAPYQKSRKAMNRGTTIHSLVETYKGTGDRIENIPRQYQGYAMAFYDFMAATKASLIEQERTLFCEKPQIAGTLDIYAQIGDKKHIIDVKTGKDIYPEVGLQLSAYAHMMREAGKEVDEISVLLLETGADDLPTGKYKFQTLTEDFMAFRAAHRLYCYLNEAKLNQYGYQWK